MSFDPSLCLSTTLPLAKAAYDKSLLPTGWEIVAAIEPDDFGFVFRKIDPATGDIIVAIGIPGTRNLEQWLWDFDNLPVGGLYGVLGHVHKGFQDAYSRIRTSLFAGLAGLDYDELWVIGHSLGGALAQLLARELAMRFKLAMTDGPKILCDPVLWTFESPRPWCVDAVACFNQTVSTAWLIENHADIVPRLPPEAEGFKTGNTVILLQPPMSTDAHVNHALATCAQGLQKLIAATS
jgi:hypothetical protein